LSLPFRLLLTHLLQLHAKPLLFRFHRRQSLGKLTSLGGEMLVTRGQFVAFRDE
jgi:hypothetical protein